VGGDRAQILPFGFYRRGHHGRPCRAGSGWVPGGFGRPQACGCCRLGCRGRAVSARDRHFRYL